MKVLLPWNLWTEGSDYQWSWSLIPKLSPGKLLGHPASLCLPALKLLHPESSEPASLSHCCSSGGSGLPHPKVHRSSGPKGSQVLSFQSYFHRGPTTFQRAGTGLLFFSALPREWARGSWLPTTPSPHTPVPWREGLFLCRSLKFQRRDND